MPSVDGGSHSPFVSVEEMEEVIERLGLAAKGEASKADEEADAEYALGRQIGIEWAKRSASPQELSDVVVLRSGGWYTWHLAEDHSLAAFLAGRRDAEALDYQFIRGEMDLVSSPLVDGIIDGASAVWEVVVPRLGWRRHGKASSGG